MESIKQLINDALQLASNAAAGAIDVAESATEATQKIADKVYAGIINAGGTPEQAAKVKQEIIDDVL